MWGFVKSIGSWFSGGGKTVDKVTELIDESVYTSQERTEQDAQDTNNARTWDIGSSGNTWFNAFVDGINRLPRPAFAIWAFGELVGWWNVAMAAISAEKMNLIILIITFYFGGRVILKDLPSIIKMLRAK